MTATAPTGSSANASRKLRVGVLFGGRSAEHAVSIQSARNVSAALDRSKYDVVLIGIDQTGQWRLSDAEQLLGAASKRNLATLKHAGALVTAVPGQTQSGLVSLAHPNALRPLDVVFPVLHGPFGEDGSVQGFLKLAGIPFVGAGVLGSALGMDKDVQKRLFREAGIPTARWLAFQPRHPADVDYATVCQTLGHTVFIKPANLGSSVGVNKATDHHSFVDGVTEALSFDRKIVIEEAIEGREIECAILGGDPPSASVPGEVQPQAEYYSYEAKYIDEHGPTIVIPAALPASTIANVQRQALHAFTTLDCEGLARVDFFLTPDGQLLVNELNTIPGFTSISLYPKLWEASGLPLPKLLDRLISLARERFAREQQLRTTYTPS